MATWLKRKLKKVMAKDETPVSMSISTAEGAVTLSKKEVQRYTLLHLMLTSDMSGEIGGAEGAAFLMRSGLPKDALHTVWKLASGGKSKARLTKEDFFVACKLVAAAQVEGQVSMGPLLSGMPLDLADFHYGVTPDGSLGGADGEASEFPATAIKITLSNPQSFGSGMDKHTKYQVSTSTSLAHFPRKEIQVWRYVAALLSARATGRGVAKGFLPSLSTPPVHPLPFHPPTLNTQHTTTTTTTTHARTHSHRRFSDFVWLNTRLSITYPAAVIPPFPAKRVVNNSDPEFVRARQTALEVYLERVARHPRMGTSLDLIVFLDANESGLEAAKQYIEDYLTEQLKPEVMPYSG